MKNTTNKKLEEFLETVFLTGNLRIRLNGNMMKKNIGVVFPENRLV